MCHPRPCVRPPWPHFVTGSWFILPGDVGLRGNGGQSHSGCVHSDGIVFNRDAYAWLSARYCVQIGASSSHIPTREGRVPTSSSSSAAVGTRAAVGMCRRHEALPRLPVALRAPRAVSDPPLFGWSRVWRPRSPGFSPARFWGEGRGSKPRLAVPTKPRSILLLRRQSADILVELGVHGLPGPAHRQQRELLCAPTGDILVLGLGGHCLEIGLCTTLERACKSSCRAGAVSSWNRPLIWAQTSSRNESIIPDARTGPREWVETFGGRRHEQVVTPGSCK